MSSRRGPCELSQATARRGSASSSSSSQVRDVSCVALGLLCATLLTAGPPNMTPCPSDCPDGMFMPAFNAELAYTHWQFNLPSSQQKLFCPRAGFISWP